jgi:curved DNA-binding protein CbpA
MDSRLINPFSLLGISSTSSPSDLKRAYYSLSLMCHPDKGGDSKDMIVVSQAYQYVKEQLDKIRDTSYEELEEEFQEFCKHQEEIKPPTFSSIFEETHEWIDDFNKKFETMNLNRDEEINNMGDNEYNPYSNNPFQQGGYGDIMDESEINLDSCYSQEDLQKMRENDNEKNTHQFDKQIIEYKEPESLPNTVTSYPLLPSEITDFSGSSSNKNTHNKSMEMTDYKKAFTPPEDLPEVEPERDYPNQVLEYNPSVY